MNFFTSDLHFGHENVSFKYDKRPYTSLEDMNEQLIKNWNRKVKPSDTVYILGDVSFYRDFEKTKEIVKRLNGHLILIKGNHDRLTPEFKSLFDKVYDYLEIKEDDVKVILCHYPIFFYNGHYRNSIMLYGHLHNSEEETLCQELIKMINEKSVHKMYNVGIMNWNYEPVSLKEILNS